MKKKILLISFTIFMLLLIPSNAFAFTCEALPDVLIDDQVPQIIKSVLLIIQILVPILLGILGVIDLLKGVYAQKEDEIKKGQQVFIKRLITGLLVFFVIAIVKLVISVVGNTEDPTIMSCVKCFIYGAEEDVC